MPKLHQLHQRARQGVGGAECQIRNTTGTRRSGRRAIRGVVLLAGLLGSVAALGEAG